jgi:hypothetical protein
MAQYGDALLRADRARIASLYHWETAQLVRNGVSQVLTRAQITDRYRTRWTPPAYFAWDSLQYHAIPPASVLVVGRFCWLPSQNADTLRYAYVALLVAIDSGMAIRVEHETRLP